MYTTWPTDNPDHNPPEKLRVYGLGPSPRATMGWLPATRQYKAPTLTPGARWGRARAQVLVGRRSCALRSRLNPPLVGFPPAARGGSATTRPVQARVLVVGASDKTAIVSSPCECGCYLGTLADCVDCARALAGIYLHAQLVLQHHATATSKSG